MGVVCPQTPPPPPPPPKRGGGGRKKRKAASGPKTPHNFLLSTWLAGAAKSENSEKIGAKNLRGWQESFRDHCLITRTEKLRFLRTYLQWNLHGRENWKRYWQEITAATEAKVARNEMTGRVLK